MIWGKSIEDKEKLGNQHKWFAWRPVKLDGERWAWLQFIYRQVIYGSKASFSYYQENLEGVES